MKDLFKSNFLASVILFFLGLLLIFQSQATIEFISYIIGAILVAAGAFALIRYVKINTKGLDTTDLDLLYGIVSVILGILVISNPHAIASIIPIVIGIAIIISCAGKIQYAFDMKKTDNDLWKATMVLAIVGTICGIVLVFNPFAGAKFLIRIVGTFIVIYSVLDLISTLIISKNVEEFKNIESKTIEAEVVEEKDDNKDNKKEEKKDKSKKKNSKKENK